VLTERGRLGTTYLSLFSFLFCAFQLTQQMAEMQRMQKTAEATVRQLRVDLAAAQKELAAAQARDRTRNDSEDSRIQGFLQKISKLDEELVAARYVIISERNAFFSCFY
jgi:hypothetical protein